MCFISTDKWVQKIAFVRRMFWMKNLWAKVKVALMSNYLIFSACIRSSMTISLQIKQGWSFSFYFFLSHSDRSQLNNLKPREWPSLSYLVTDCCSARSYCRTLLLGRVVSHAEEKSPQKNLSRFMRVYPYRKSVPHFTWNCNLIVM